MKTNRMYAQLFVILAKERNRKTISKKFGMFCSKEDKFFDCTAITYPTLEKLVAAEKEKIDAICKFSFNLKSSPLNIMDAISVSIPSKGNRAKRSFEFMRSLSTEERDLFFNLIAKM